MVITIIKILAPEPVILPDVRHLLDRHILSFGEEEVYEHRHGHNPRAKEEEEPELHVAEHRKKRLSDEECEQHVDGHVDTLPC